MPLGHAFELVISVPDLGEASRFYQRLGFRWAFGGRPAGSAEWVTDGRVVIVLTEGPPAPARLLILSDEVEAAADLVEAAGASIGRGPTHGGRLRSFSFEGPSRLDIVVIEAERGASIALPGESPSDCGTFGEISVLTPSADRSHAFWASLGFTPVWFPPAPRRTGSMTDGVLTIGFYEPGTCSHAFRSPALTYFEANMHERLAALKADGWTFLEEIPAQDGPTLGHAILEAPGGLHLFLFGTYP